MRNQVKERFGVYCYTVHYRDGKPEVVSFEKIINELFQNQGRFVKDYDLIARIRRQEDEIKERGVLKVLFLSELYYYQTDVHIDGQGHTPDDVPKSVIEHEGKLYLMNGYHRLW
jgi:hypothetical protein